MEEINDQRIGFCDYCHDPVFKHEDYTKKRGKLYHTDCYEQKNNFKEELDFNYD